MRLPRLARLLPDWKSALLALASAGLLIGAFPNFEYWFLAWFALVPLMFAVEREKASSVRSFLTGWLFGTSFFFGTCWWLAYAPIHYASFPPLLAYSLVLIATAGAGLFPAIFAGLLSFLLRRFGSRAFLAAPFVWAFTEFLRYWLTGNNWNAIGYSQAFTGLSLEPAAFGGVLFVGFLILLPCSFVLVISFEWQTLRKNERLSEAFGAAVSKGFLAANLDKNVGESFFKYYATVIIIAALAFVYLSYLFGVWPSKGMIDGIPSVARIVAIQPNVPMAGLDYQKWEQLRERQIAAAEAEITKLRTTNNEQPTTVILPESPMNFMYEDDREFRDYINAFARRNNVSVLFNSAEPDRSNGKFFNSAVMIDPEGRKVAQYDKIYLLPFGEAVPVPLESLVPAFVGSFSYGKEYDVLQLGEAKAGVMICFESHFGQLSREYVRNGADVIIEMTNDGYLGPTPVLRQHLANAVFRAVETNRPVLRVTNVGITAYINERGQVLDSLPSYAEGSRIWSVSKSDGTQTLYVRYGDWFAWLCTIITLGLLLFSMRRKAAKARA